MRKMISVSAAYVILLVFIFCTGCISVIARKEHVPEEQFGTTLSGEPQDVKALEEEAKEEHLVEESIVFPSSGTDLDQIKAFYRAWNADIEGNLKHFCHRNPDMDFRHVLNVIYPFTVSRPEASFTLLQPLRINSEGIPVEISFIAINTYYDESLMIVVKPEDEWFCRAMIDVTPVPVTEENLESFLETLHLRKDR